MEEVIEEGLKTLQKWEGDRLKAVKTGESDHARCSDFIRRG